MEVIQYIPGNIGGGATHTIPDAAPEIGEVVSAEIERLPSALDAHAAGAVLAHAATATAVGHANSAVADHAPHAHSLRSQGTTVAPTFPLGWDAVPGIGQLEDQGAAAPHSLAAGLATGVMDYVMPAHVVTQPDAHPAADVVASIDDHADADVALALADHEGADPVVAAGAVVKLTPRTFTIANATLLGDLLTLAYHAVGERVAVA